MVPSDRLYADPPDRAPDYVIVLAWNFAEPIIANHQEFLDRGGRFIVPLPEVRVV